MRIARGAASGSAARLLFGIGSCLAGCTGSLFQTNAPPPSTYLLSADLGAVADAGQRAAGGSPATTRIIAADLAVQRPQVRTGLDTDRIAVLYPDKRLDYFADARWSGPLDQVIQDLAVQAFETGAHLRNVSAESSAFPSGYWLEIQVADFEAEYAAAGSAPTVHVHLTARLGAAGDRRMLGTFDANARESAAVNRLSVIVGAYERAADAALVQIVTDVSRALAGAENVERPATS